MVEPKIVQDQIQKLGFVAPFWGKAEINELPHILIPGEEIKHLINGRYSGGFATICATNHRLLLIDKKLFFLNVEDIRYDMIAEVDYGHQGIGATIHILSFSKDLKFQSFKKTQLRDVAGFVQGRVMDLRGHQTESYPNTPHIAQTLETAVSTADTTPAIPIQVFDTGSMETNDLTEMQIQSLLPVHQDKWYKINPSRRIVNPYSQTPLSIRKRVGRFRS